MAQAKLIITIDGPAGSGKSTTARCVAKQLGYLYLDSGALYRALTLAALRQQVDFSDSEALVQIARNSNIRLIPASEGVRVFLNDKDVTTEIRLPEVSRAIGPVAANPKVREILLGYQRQLAAEGGIVAEGRDMGTVVFPEASLKYFMSASIDERAKRRQKDLAVMGIQTDLETIKLELRKRDEDDSHRQASPLRRPDDAIDIDTTQLSILQQVDMIVEDAMRLGAMPKLQVVVDPIAGFCPGVKRAIAMIEAELPKGELLALGSVIHNQRELDRLAVKGLRTIPQDEMSFTHIQNLQGKRILIRTHGIGTQLRQQLQENGAFVIDATCPVVHRVQKMVADFHAQGYQIAIVGKKKHAEVIGLLGHCDHKGIVIESQADINELDANRKTVVIAQTTIGQDRFYQMVELIKQRLNNVLVQDTNCRYISRRYDQIAEFARSVKVVIFIGGKESSNARVLFAICRQHNEKSYQIESVAELQAGWYKDADLIGITGAASTPSWQLDEVKEYILCK